MTGTERTIQVPVSLIERAPHAPGCQVAGLWILPENGGRAVQQSGKCTCWKAEVDALLSQPTPSAERDDLLSCLELGDDGNYHWDTDMLDRLLERHMGEFPAAPPRIEDMAPGTTFTAPLRDNSEDRRWMVTAHGLASSDGSAGVDSKWIDPSTIRDVTPPKD